MPDTSSFVVCNDEFGIKRFVHGMPIAYNDIEIWHFKDHVEVFVWVLRTINIKRVGFR